MRKAAPALLMLVASCTATVPPPATVPEQGGAVVHLFEWRWADVAEECETVLGPAGWSAVQVSPVTENHVVGGRPWWERYQPVSYRLETRSGDREAFADMVGRCEAAGVRVIADVILNHMTDADLEHPTVEMTGTGVAGTRFEPYSYPGLWSYDDFHHCGLAPNDDMADANDPVQRRECELVDLADLDTGSPRVQARLGEYLRDLAGLGVAGIRIDAARHIAPEDIGAILDSAGWSGYVVMEVRGPETGEFTPMGSVTDFAFGPIVTEAVRKGRLDALAAGEAAWQRDTLPGDSALVFIDNHDTQRGHGGALPILTHRDGESYDLAVAFMLAYGRGRPRVMSSYAFDSDSQGPPTRDGDAILAVHGPDGAGCGGAWVCEHRRPGIAGMVGFQAAVDGTPVTGWQSDVPDRVAFSRGDRGFAMFNASAKEATFEVHTPVAPGRYCDVAQGPPAEDGACAGRALTVEADGSVRVAVPAMGVAALHAGAPAP